MASCPPPPLQGPHDGSRPRENNGKAVASLICALASLVICPPTAIAAVILGPLAMREMAAQPDRYEGRNMAVIGQVVGWLSVLFWGVMGLWIGVIVYAAGTG